MKSIIIYVEENDKEYTICVGENKNENDEIIKMSNQDDTWFHLDNISGPHIILKNNGDRIPKRYLNNIAGLFSQYKSNLPHRYNVIYTLIKNVKLTNIQGQVNVTNTKLIKM